MHPRRVRPLLAALLLCALLAVGATSALAAGSTTVGVKDDFSSPKAKTVAKGTTVRTPSGSRATSIPR